MQENGFRKEKRRWRVTLYITPFKRRWAGLSSSPSSLTNKNGRSVWNTVRLHSVQVCNTTLCRSLSAVMNNIQLCTDTACTFGSFRLRASTVPLCSFKEISIAMHCKVGEKVSQCVRQTLGLTGVTPVIRGSWVGSAVTVEMMMEYAEPRMNCDFRAKFGTFWE